MSTFFQRYKWVLVLIFGIIFIGGAYIAGTGTWPSFGMTASSTPQIATTTDSQAVSSSTDSTKTSKKTKSKKKTKTTQ